jgi:transposase
MTRAHPAWAIQHKKPGTELRLIRGRYYLYEVSSKWNPVKKRAQKITGKIIGSITQEKGFVPSRRNHQNSALEVKLVVKEYGATSFLTQLANEVIEPLKHYFPEDWQSLVMAAFFRLLYQAPLKNMDFYFSKSFCSETYQSARLSPKAMTELLRRIGGKRDKITAYFSEFTTPGEHVLMDITAMTSRSESLSLAKKGYNSQGGFDPQINLLLIFSQTLTMPIYYRLLPGNIRDVKAFKLSLLESKIRDAILVADKGFYSRQNSEALDEAGLHYLLPLRRNSSLIDYSPLDKPHKAGMEGYFKYNNRYIWFWSQKIENKKIFHFLDDYLRHSEERDYLDRIQSHPEDYSFEEFQEKGKRFGTFTIYTNITNKSAEEIYLIYKTRMNIECAADTLKNLIQADRSYMRDDQALEGWMFINHLALAFFYKIHHLLNKHELLSKLSPKDLLIHLSEIKKIKLDHQWKLAEITFSTQKLLTKLNLHIT